MNNQHLLKGLFTKKGDQKFIELSWELKGLPSDHSTIQLFSSKSPKQPLILDTHFPELLGSSILYHIDYYFSKTYCFYLKVETQSCTSYSNKIAVTVPTIDLPPPRVHMFRVLSDKTYIEWKFPFNIPDLKEFIVLNNHKKLPLSIPKNQRSAIIPNHLLKHGCVNVQAVTLSKYAGPLSMEEIGIAI